MDTVKMAVMDDTGKYRYFLSRVWEKEQGIVAFIMLNPSTADAEINDPTIRRCIGFATDWGYGGVTVANVFAYRSTSPKQLEAADDPYGPLNDKFLEKTVNGVALVVAAWGAWPHLHKRFDDIDKVVKIVKASGKNLYCLGLTAGGAPCHPLYIKRGTIPEIWI